MANSPVAWVLSDRSRSVLAPHILVLSRHHLALGDAWAQGAARSAEIRHEAGAVRAAARSLRSESARRRAAREVWHRSQCPLPEADRVAWRLAELMTAAHQP